MNTVNHSFSIPREEFASLTAIKENCGKTIKNPNLTEMVRVAIFDLKSKEPHEISRILDQIGRKKPGRAQKEESASERRRAAPTDEDRQLPTDDQWHQIENLLGKKGSANDRERLILSEILLDLRFKWRRDVDKPGRVSAATKWRRLKKWQETGVWAQICRTILKSLPEDARPLWTSALLESYLSKRIDEIN